MGQAKNLLRELPSVVVTRVVSAQPRRYVTIPLK
jgi:hypothetical protein